MSEARGTFWRVEGDPPTCIERTLYRDPFETKHRGWWYDRCPHEPDHLISPVAYDFHMCGYADSPQKAWELAYESAAKEANAAHRAYEQAERRRLQIMHAPHDEPRAAAAATRDATADGEARG